MIASAIAGAKRIVSRHFALLIYALLYLLVVMVVLPPDGEALLTDDCDYSITVFKWLESGKLQLSDFPSMTLIGHLAWGAAFAKCFGANQVVLRASTMVMVWLGGLAIYSLAIAHRRSPNLAAFCTATYVFHPFLVFYAYTFNTDVAGCSTMLVFLALAEKTGKANSMLPFLCLGLLGGFCLLIRQTASIPAIWYAVALAFWVAKRQLHWSKLAVYGLAFAILPVAYFAWLLLARDWPIGYEKRFLVFWQLCHVKIMAVKLARLALAIGIYTLPIVLTCLKFESKHVLRWSVVLLAWLVCTSSLLFVDRLKPIRPYWSQEFYDAGFGKQPDVLGLGEWIRSPSLPRPLNEVSLFDFVVVPLSVLSLFSWLYLLGKQFKGFYSNRQSWQREWLGNRCPILLMTFASQCFLMVVVWDVFDRYFMPVISMAIVLLSVCPLGKSPSLKWGNAILFFTTVIGLLAIQDSRCQNEAAWKLANHLVGRGIPADRIWIGHQFFGTHAYLPAFYRRLEEVQGNIQLLDRNERGLILKGLSKIQFRVAQGNIGIKTDSAIARLRFSSWIRSYEFFAVPVAED